MDNLRGERRARLFMQLALALERLERLAQLPFQLCDVL
jgi:hypothetical protein